MKIRVGVEGGRRPVLAKCAELRAPILVSANSMWNARRERFTGWESYRGFDVALDSGGFVAMARYGRYRWSHEQYVALAKVMGPTWWAQMDYCCEPELASDSGAVARRIDMTARSLEQCQRIADLEAVPMPLIVLQGWKPDDYVRGPIYDREYQWPDLVGVGSVCRRNVFGSDGLLNVIRRLDEVLPTHTRLHLFGVKSQALDYVLKEFPDRVESMDSMAWSMRARWDALTSNQSCSNQFRAEYLGTWYSAQKERVDDAKGRPVQKRLL